MTTQAHASHSSGLGSDFRVGQSMLPSNPKRAAEEEADPMMLKASHVYVPRQQVPSSPLIILWMSPGWSSVPSLYHLSTGWGTPITCPPTDIKRRLVRLARVNMQPPAGVPLPPHTQINTYNITPFRKNKETNIFQWHEMDQERKKH